MLVPSFAAAAGMCLNEARRDWLDKPYGAIYCCLGLPETSPVDPPRLALDKPEQN